MTGNGLGALLRDDAARWRQGAAEVKAQGFRAKDNTALGRDLEDLVAELIQDRLHVDTRNGCHIRPRDGEDSREADVVLLAQDSCRCNYPPNLTVPIPRGRSVQRDHCWGMIESKSSLTKDDLLGDLDKIALVHGFETRQAVERPELAALNGGHLCGRFFGGIVAYSTPFTKVSTLKGHLEDWCAAQESSEYWPSIVAVMGLGCFVRMTDAGIVRCQIAPVADAVPFSFVPADPDYDVLAVLLFAISGHLMHSGRTHLPLHYQLGAEGLSIGASPRPV
jgi:hypothetical protein